MQINANSENIGSMNNSKRKSSTSRKDSKEIRTKQVNSAIFIQKNESSKSMSNTSMTDSVTSQDDITETEIQRSEQSIMPANGVMESIHETKDEHKVISICSARIILL